MPRAHGRVPAGAARGGGGADRHPCHLPATVAVVQGRHADVSGVEVSYTLRFSVTVELSPGIGVLQQTFGGWLCKHVNGRNAACLNADSVLCCSAATSTGSVVH